MFAHYFKKNIIQGNALTWSDPWVDFLDTGHVLTGAPKIYSALAKLLAPDIKAIFDEDQVSG